VKTSIRNLGRGPIGPKFWWGKGKGEKVNVCDGKLSSSQVGSVNTSDRGQGGSWEFAKNRGEVLQEYAGAAAAVNGGV